MFMKIEDNNKYAGYVSWTARGTQDGAVPAKSFYATKGSDKVDVTEAFTKGVTVDIWSLKLGFIKSNAGSAPDKVWAASLTEPIAQPTEDHKRAFSVEIDIDGDTYLWEQNAFGAYIAIEDLGRDLNKSAPLDSDKKPLCMLKGTRAVGSKHVTYVPELEIVRFV